MECVGRNKQNRFYGKGGAMRAFGFMCSGPRFLVCYWMDRPADRFQGDAKMLVVQFFGCIALQFARGRTSESSQTGLGYGP